MSVAVINLPIDKTGYNPDNLIVGERHELTATAGVPYKLVTLVHGGFYEKEHILYDKDYERLLPGTDYVLTYFHKDASDHLGLKVYSLIVLLNQTLTDCVYVTAQMVGGDLAYSFTVEDDYVRYFLSNSYGYIPTQRDFDGSEPIYHPGELEKLRWKLDTYQPFNNEIHDLARAVVGMYGDEEEILREHIRATYQDFVDSFNNIIKPHVDDLDNPHNTEKRHVGLSLVNNFNVASPAEALAGDLNNRYMTPALTWQQFDLLAIQPMDTHIARRDNPHEVTPEQLKTVVKDVVDTKVALKYYKEEVVEDARNGYFNGIKSYARILTEFRTLIPATAFTTGFVNPARMALGTPSATSVITSSPFRWSDWNDLLAIYKPNVPSTIATASFGSGTARSTAHSFIATQLPYRDLPNNSIVLYKIYQLSGTAWGNGGTAYYYSWFTYMSYKNNNGLWTAV